MSWINIECGHGTDYQGIYVGLRVFMLKWGSKKFISEEWGPPKLHGVLYIFYQVCPCVNESFHGINLFLYKSYLFLWCLLSLYLNK